MAKAHLSLTLYHTMATVDTLRKKSYENFVGKGENGRQYIFLADCTSCAVYAV